MINKYPFEDIEKVRRRVRSLLIFFIAALCLSGLTAFPLETELRLAHQWLQAMEMNNAMSLWIHRVYEGVADNNRKFPFIAYGTDWLAFAHLVIAVAFIGPLRDPVRNIWVIKFGLVAAAAVIPMAFIAGEVRNIPVLWRLIDCTFGLVGGFVLWRCYSDIKILEKKR